MTAAEHGISPEMVSDARALLASTTSVSILTHINPDADTIGTGLGIFALLKEMLSVPVEIVNVSKDIPRYLDFLPHYQKIKKQSDFEHSLVITCDGGSPDRFGMPLSDRQILNIDHHHSNQHYGTVNVVIDGYASASQVAYRLFEQITSISYESALCFYAALFSDTRHFTTSAVNQEVFAVASELIAYGIDPSEVAFHFTQRQSLASLRILERALHSLELYREGRVAIMTITVADQQATGATMPDMEGIVDYGRSLATVEVAVLLIALRDGGVKGSLRSKGKDVSQLASVFGGGGHKAAAGFIVPKAQMQEIIDTILEHIASEENAWQDE